MVRIDKRPAPPKTAPSEPEKSATKPKTPPAKDAGKKGLDVSSAAFASLPKLSKEGTAKVTSHLQHLSQDPAPQVTVAGRKVAVSSDNRGALASILTKLNNAGGAKKAQEATGHQTIRAAVGFWQTKSDHDNNALAWAKGLQEKNPSAANAGQVTYYKNLVTADQGALNNVKAASAESIKLWGTDDIVLDDKAESSGGVSLSKGIDSEVAAAGGPKISDVKQGSLGDCYMIASLATLAQQSPKTITDNIRPGSKPGEYQVKIFQHDPKNPKKLIPVVETVDTKDFHVQPQVDPANGKAILWPALYEQAFAQSAQKGNADASGFSRIEGGFSHNALPQLTGKNNISSVFGAGKDQSSLAYLQKNLAEGKPVCVASNGLTKATTGIVGPHEYTVVSVSPDLKSVTLRNPWGVWAQPVTDPRVKVGKDGQATIPVELYNKAFDNEITVGNT